jgi:hypothetical protein
VVPLCIDLRPAEITGPLLTFQGRELSEESIFDMVEDINMLSERPLTQDTLQKTFKAMWPSLSSELEEILSRSFESESQAEHRAVPEMVEEIVNRVREIEKIVDGRDYGAQRDSPARPKVAPYEYDLSRPVERENEAGYTIPPRS